MKTIKKIAALLLSTILLFSSLAVIPAFAEDAADTTSANRVTFDFTTGGKLDEMFLKYHVNGGILTNDGGMNEYVTIKSAWNEAKFILDYTLESNTEYVVTWNRAIRQIDNNIANDITNGFYIMNDSFGGFDRNSGGVYSFTQQNENSSAPFVNSIFSFKTGDLEEGVNYLGLYCNYDIAKIDIKSITIQKKQDEAIYDFSKDGTFDRLVNFNNAKGTNDHYMKLDNGTLLIRTFYGVNTFGFDYVLSPNTDYEVTLMYSVSKAALADKTCGLFRMPNSKSDVIGDNTKLIKPLQTVTSGYQKETFTFNSGDLADGNNILGFSSYANDLTLRIQYLIIDKYDPNEVVDTNKASFNFEGSEKDYYRLNNISLGGKNKYLTADGSSLNLYASWSDIRFDFGFELTSNTTYRVTWERKITKVACYDSGKGRQIGFYGVSSSTELDYAKLDNENWFYRIPHQTTESEFKTETFTFTTGEITDSNKYFGMIASGDTVNIAIRSLTIEYLVDGELYEPKYIGLDSDLETSGFTYHYTTDAGATETTEFDANGNRYLTLANETGKSTQMAYRTNLELEADTDYTLSFKFKSDDTLDQFFISAGNSNDNWLFFQEYYGTGKDARKYCLIGDEQTQTYDNGANSFTYRDGNLDTEPGDWRTMTVTFNTGSVVDTTHKYLTFCLKFWGKSAYSVSLDEIVLTKAGETRGESNTVVLNMGHNRNMAYANIDNLPTVDTENGFIFSGWYTDVDRSEAFVYSPEAEIPNILYAGYDLDVNGDDACNILDLIRMKKVAIGESVTYTDAIDPNHDDSVDATDLTFMKKCLLF